MNFFSAAPLVNLIGLNDCELLLVSNHKFKPGAQIKVRANLTDSNGQTRLVNFKVLISSMRPGESKGEWICVAELANPLPFKPMVRREATPRNSERVACCLRLASPDLPGFTALSLDLSQTGLQLRSRGSVALGSVIRLRLDAHLTEWESLHLSARVAWHLAESDGGHLLGVEFVDLDPETRQRLWELDGYMNARTEAPVLHLSLAYADQFLRRPRRAQTAPEYAL